MQGRYLGWLRGASRPERRRPSCLSPARRPEIAGVNNCLTSNGSTMDQPSAVCQFDGDNAPRARKRGYEMMLRNGLIGFLLLVAGCAPSPKSVRCSNGGDCAKVDARFHYCLQARCVECVGDAECGSGARVLGRRLRLRGRSWMRHGADLRGGRVQEPVSVQPPTAPAPRPRARRGRRGAARRRALECARREARHP